MPTRNTPRNPLDALQKAESIGPDPLGQSQLTLGQMPLDPAFLKSLGKPIAELLGMVLQTPNKTGLPSRLRLSNWNARDGMVNFKGLRRGASGAEGFDASPQQLDTLIDDGTLNVAQPPQGAVDAIRKKLAALLGGS